MRIDGDAYGRLRIGINIGKSRCGDLKSFVARELQVFDVADTLQSGIVQASTTDQAQAVPTRSRGTAIHCGLRQVRCGKNENVIAVPALQHILPAATADDVVTRGAHNDVGRLGANQRDGTQSLRVQIRRIDLRGFEQVFDRDTTCFCGHHRSGKIDQQSAGLRFAIQVQHIDRIGGIRGIGNHPSQCPWRQGQGHRGGCNRLSAVVQTRNGQGPLASHVLDHCLLDMIKQDAAQNAFKSRDAAARGRHQLEAIGDGLVLQATRLARRLRCQGQLQGVACLRIVDHHLKQGQSASVRVCDRGSWRDLNGPCVRSKQGCVVSCHKVIARQIHLCRVIEGLHTPGQRFGRTHRACDIGQGQHNRAVRDRRIGRIVLINNGIQQFAILLQRGFPGDLQNTVGHVKVGLHPSQGRGQ